MIEVNGGPKWFKIEGNWKLFLLLYVVLSTTCVVFYFYSKPHTRAIIPICGVQEVNNIYKNNGVTYVRQTYKHLCKEA